MAPSAGSDRSRAPLRGVRVVDMTWAWAGPHGTQLLAWLGAEVIKVESRSRLDHSRVRSLMGGVTAGGPDHSPIFNDLNTDKRSVTLNLRHEEARALLKRLVGVSDVLVQNMRPGVMDRLGLSYEALSAIRPDLVMLSSSAVGGTGPERDYAGYAPTFSSLAGIADLTGYPDGPPTPLSGSVDLRVGTAGALAVVAALYRRRRTGKGQHIDLSSTEVVCSMMGEAFLEHAMNGRVPARQGNRHDVMAPHDCFPCAGDGQFVSIAIGSDAEWAGLRHAIGDPALDDDRFAGPAERFARQDALGEIVAAWTRSRDVDEVVRILQAAGVPAMRVHEADSVADDPHVKARGFIREIDHPVVGPRRIVGVPWRFGAGGVDIDRHAPLLGEHNDYVLGDLLGLSPDEIRALTEAGALD